MTTEQRNETAQVPADNEDEVQATIYNFDRFQIKKYLHRDITILEVTGEFSPIMAKKVERQAAEVRGNLGLDLAGVKRLQSNFLSVLQRVHKKATSKNRRFVLCNPPERLLDFLKLNDLMGRFQIATDDGVSASPGASTSIVDGLATAPTNDLVGATRDLETIPVSKEITHLNKSLKRTEKLEKGLDSASECVRKILPSTCPTHPDYDFAFSYRPSDKVGGDFFDFIPLGDDVLGIVIGDVSGHGIDSAIIMGMAKKVMRLRAKDLAHRSAAEVLAQSNYDLYDELGAQLFITALFARVNLSQGLVSFARAGHEPPILFASGSKRQATACMSDGLALGIDPGKKFAEVIEEKRIQLEAGDGILLYTDGIVESWNARRDLFSRPRLAYTLEQLGPSSTAATVLSSIDAAVDGFAQGVPPEDDMTAIVMVRY